MHFHLRKVILWPRLVDEGPRVLRFESARLNVITGRSQTGKSAIIPIVDYCLASEKCAIPTDTIRIACAWFGVVFETPYGQVLLARREPGADATSSEMYFTQGSELDIPRVVPDTLIHVSRVKEILNELSGVPGLPTSNDTAGTGFKARPSFRDMMSFTFQPQHIVANPNVLFYKADSFEGREKLRAVFPFVLNAVDAEGLERIHELNRLRHDLRRKEKELQGLRSVSTRWVAEARAKVMTAVELGLTDPPEPDAVFNDLVRVLRRLASQFTPESLLRGENLEAAARELTDLQNEENSLSGELTFLRRRMAEMDRLRDASDQYGDSIAIRRDRLSIASWMKEIAGHHECPVCGSGQAFASSEIAALVDALAVQEAEAGNAGQFPATFDRERQRVKSLIGDTVERLNATRLRRRALEASSEAARRSQFQALSVARFLGSIDQAVQGLESVSSDSDLAAEVADLAARVKELGNGISDLDLRRAMDRSKARFQFLANEILPSLNAERSDPVQLVPEELTLKLVGNNREDFLWEIGSGANWVSYHVAAILALHHLFLSQRSSPVPSFVVFDQPSQAHFPRDMDAEAPGKDADVEAVRRIYATLSDAVERTKGKLQVIVIDHADKMTWGNVRLNEVANWHDGEKLVPPHWVATIPNPEHGT